ncbi:MAG: hypothetical protein V3U20_00460 [Thermoplasmata archaeon]
MRIDQIREKILITIFGSHAALDRLQSLRDRFRSEGYSNTNLVMDYDSIKGIDLRNYTDYNKCNLALEKSGCNLFVFLLDVDNQGPASELLYALERPEILRRTIIMVEMPEKLDYSESSDVVVSSYLRSHTAYKKVNVGRFLRGDYDDLFVKARQRIFSRIFEENFLEPSNFR